MLEPVEAAERIREVWAAAEDKHVASEAGLEAYQVFAAPFNVSHSDDGGHQRRVVDQAVW